MTISAPRPPFAVLFVDDEHMARKYFAKIFANDFEVITAADAAEARHLIESNGTRIGVLVTDQRMPGAKGVELLSYIRDHFPNMVRILTTAYADYDEAVTAVNQGGIFRYIHKPWDIPQLRDTLIQGMELFMLRHERELLLREKLSILQSDLKIHRSRDLVTLAGSLPNLRYSLHAVQAFITQLCTADDHAAPHDETVNLNYWRLYEQELQRSLATARHIKQLLYTDWGSPAAFQDRLSIKELFSGLKGIAFSSHGTDTRLNVNGPHARLLLHLLVSDLTGLGQREVAVAMTDEENGHGITLQLSGTEKSTRQNLLTTPPGADVGKLSLHANLLAGYFIAYHHAGGITLEYTAEDRLIITLQLPCAPELHTLAPLNPDWLEVLFSGLEDGS